MLKLKLPTDPRWVDIAGKQLEEILTDHAYCEQKAASTGISLIVQYPEKEELVETVTQLVAEEWSHFKRVIKELKKRGLKLGAQRKDEYVIALMAHMRKGGSREQQLMDKLLICALIEARSCERFKLLWQNLEDEALKTFYYDFMVSEAGHFTTFVELAKLYLPADVVDKRFEVLLTAEAEIIQNLAWRSDRVH
jgi:tRNA-(ms[2]io[6]A)-hydroxylase